MHVWTQLLRVQENGIKPLQTMQHCGWCWELYERSKAAIECNFPDASNWRAQWKWTNMLFCDLFFYLSFWVNFVLTFHLGSICICFAFVSSRFYMGKLQLVFQDLFNIKWYMLAWRVITLSWLFGIQLAFCFKLSFFFLLAALLICSQSAGWVHAVYVRAVFMVLLIESGACH